MVLRGGRRIVTKVVCVTGMPGSGKEEFIEVALSLGFNVVRMGDLVREEAMRRGLELIDSAVGGLANEERLEHGYGIWAERTIPKVTDSLVLIDGVRGIAEIEVFQKAFPENLYVISIRASSDIRFRRIKERKRGDATFTEEAFEERDRREMSWGIGEAMAVADFTILNEGSLEDYCREAQKALEDIIGK